MMSATSFLQSLQRIVRADTRYSKRADVRPDMARGRPHVVRGLWARRSLPWQNAAQPNANTAHEQVALATDAPARELQWNSVYEGPVHGDVLELQPAIHRAHEQVAPRDQAPLHPQIGLGIAPDHEIAVDIQSLSQDRTFEMFDQVLQTKALRFAFCEQAQVRLCETCGHERPPGLTWPRRRPADLSRASGVPAVSQAQAHGRLRQFEPDGVNPHLTVGSRQQAQLHCPRCSQRSREAAIRVANPAADAARTRQSSLALRNSRVLRLTR